MKPSPEEVTAVSLEGRKLGRYLLRHAVAHGGMASVYLAQLAGPHRFEKWVAVKVIHPHLATDRRFVTMFLDEARMAARIHHPNVCSVVDFGEHDGIPYLVMEYLHGETLSSFVRRAWDGEPPKPWVVARIVADAARGLHAAHELKDDDGKLLGVVHRDVSPQNIVVLYDGLAKVVDFGVARARGRLTVTESGELKGKFAYMAPEQLRNLAVDRRADIWALGVVLWEATLGRRLFRADSEGETVLNVMERPVSRPTDVRPDFPPALEPILMRALERSPDDRFPTARALADALEAFLAQSGQPATASDVSDRMHALFAERLVARESLLRATLSQLVPEIELESQSSIGSKLGTIATPGIEPSPAEAEASVVRRRSSAGVWALAAAMLVLAGVVAVVAWPRDERETEPEPETETVTATEPVTVTEPETEAETVTATEPVTVTEAPPDQPSAPRTGRARERRARATPPAEPPREPPPAEPTHEPAAETGTVSLLAIPAADVYFRGRLLGRTPIANRELPAGHQTLVLRPVDGRPERTIGIEVRAHEPAFETVRF